MSQRYLWAHTRSGGRHLAESAAPQVSLCGTRVISDGARIPQAHRTCRNCLRIYEKRAEQIHGSASETFGPDTADLPGGIRR